MLMAKVAYKWNQFARAVDRVRSFAVKMDADEWA